MLFVFFPLIAYSNEYFMDILHESNLIKACHAKKQCVGQNDKGYFSKYAITSDYIQLTHIIDPQESWDNAIDECKLVGKKLLREIFEYRLTSQINNGVIRYKDDPEWNRFKTPEYYAKHGQTLYGEYDSYTFMFGIYAVKGHGSLETKKNHNMIICVYSRNT